MARAKGERLARVICFREAGTQQLWGQPELPAFPGPSRNLPVWFFEVILNQDPDPGDWELGVGAIRESAGDPIRRTCVRWVPKDRRRRGTVSTCPLRPDGNCRWEISSAGARGGL